MAVMPSNQHFRLIHVHVKFLLMHKNVIIVKLFLSRSSLIYRLLVGFNTRKLSQFAGMEISTNPLAQASLNVSLACANCKFFVLFFKVIRPMASAVKLNFPTSLFSLLLSMEGRLF